MRPEPLDLVFEDTLAVQILELVDSAELVVRANLGSVPDSSDRTKVYETLLQANYRAPQARKQDSLGLRPISANLFDLPSRSVSDLLWCT